MTATHAELAALRDLALDAIALNEQQRFLLANRTPERDCLLDDMHAIRSALRATGMVETDVDALLVGFVERLAQIVRSNDLEWQTERSLAGSLEQFASAAHAAERSAGPGPLGVKRLARELTPHLRVVRDRAMHPARDVQQAVRHIDALTVNLTPARLAGDGLRHELGDGLHGVLVDLTGAVDQLAGSTR